MSVRKTSKKENITCHAKYPFRIKVRHESMRSGRKSM